MERSSTPVAPARPPIRTARGLPYEPAIGPRLKVVLAFIFGCVAVLGATGAYLIAIRLLEWGREQTYTNQFTLWMFLAHVFVGVVRPTEQPLGERRSEEPGRGQPRAGSEDSEP